MSGPIVPPLEVTEVDGSPDGRPITKIVVSNGDLSISGRTATIDTSGSGMASFDVAGDTGSAQTISDGNTLTIKNAAGGAIKTVAQATDELTIDLTVSGVTAASYTNTSLTVDAQGRITAASSGSGVSFPLEGSDGSAATPTYSFSADTDTGIYRIGEQMIGFTSNAVRALAVYQNNLRLEGTSDPQIISCDDAGVDLELRSGGGTYGKIHIGRENENIEIVPAGTGEIEINGAYKLPLVVTGANDYLLTAQTDGSTAWAAAGGGGGGEFNLVLPYGGDIAATWYNMTATQPGWGGQSLGTYSPFTSVRFFPFLSGNTGDLASMTVNVTTAVAASTIDVGIYSDVDGLPAALIGKANIDTSATGHITQTSLSATIAMVRSTQYWICFDKVAGTGMAVRGIANGVDRLASVSIGTTLDYTEHNCFYLSGVSALPATVTTADLLSTNSNVPNIGLLW